MLGVGVSAVNMATAIAEMQGWIDRREPGYVCVSGVHGVMESHRCEALREIHNGAGLVVPDGMPMVWLLRQAGFRDADRVCGPELLPRFAAESVARGDRHFFYGGSEEATEPRRLWRRYLVNNPGFILLVMLQLLGLRSRPLHAAAAAQGGPGTAEGPARERTAA